MREHSVQDSAGDAERAAAVSVTADVVRLHDIDRTHIGIAGGKAAHLGDLSRMAGVCVPGGFCVTTRAFERCVTTAPQVDERLEQLSALQPHQRDTIAALSGEIRQTIADISMPGDLVASMTRALGASGEAAAYRHRRRGGPSGPRSL